MLEFIQASAIDLWETEGFAAGMLTSAIAMLPIVAIAYWHGRRRALVHIIERAPKHQRYGAW